MNLANKLSCLRIILAIVLIGLLLFPFYTVNIYFPKYFINSILIDTKYLIAGVIFGIASLTDFFDGYVSRKYNQTTDLGKFLDAIADKILVNTALIILASANFISALIPVIIISRDTLVDLIRMVTANKGKVVAAMNLGKIKFNLLTFGVILTFFYNLPFELWNIQMADFLLISATILAIISGVQYYQLNKNLIFDKSKK